MAKFTKTAPSKAIAKWGADVMDLGYTIVPNALIRGQARLGLSPSHINVLLHLISHWWDTERYPFPAKGSIATRMSKDKRSVQRYLLELEEAGFITRKARRGPKGYRLTNEYNLDGLRQKLSSLARDFASDELAREQRVSQALEKPRRGRRGKAPVRD